ncbi:c-type cytochrome domain-containing protein [Fodinibius sp. N2]|uniref:c-type cytochrome domain-containing protein n=1 Tax=Fodinibius alkaliphilus TaxID=3140241 RepID=UPI00315A51B0
MSTTIFSKKDNRFCTISRRSYKAFFGTLIISFGLLLSGCGGDSSTGPDPDPDPDPDPNRNVSYSQDIELIFQGNCATSGCHDSGTQESGVNLSSYQNAVNSEGNQYQELVINPDNPDESPLIDKIEPSPERGERMPYQRDPLSQADIDSIRAWIEDGAPDN